NLPLHRLGQFLPYHKLVTSWRDVLDLKSPVAIGDSKAVRWADNDVAAHVLVNIAQQPDHADLPRPLFELSARQHHLVEGTATVLRVDVVSLTIAVQEMDGSAQRDSLNPRYKLKAALIDSSCLKRPPCL